MTNQSVGFCFFKSNACGSSSGNVPILRQGSVVFSTMSLLLGLDAGGARHVLPDPGRLPSSHQGQKIHRLLLGIPFPGSPLGTARYLVKTTRFSFFKIQRALERHFEQFTEPCLHIKGFSTKCSEADLALVLRVRLKLMIGSRHAAGVKMPHPHSSLT